MPPTKKEDPLPTPEARDEFIQKIQEEPWLASIIARLEKPRFQLDMSIIDEIKDLTRLQSTAFVNGTARLPVVRSKADLYTLQEASAECLANRGRVTEIVVSYLAVKYALDALWEVAEAKLQAHAAYRFQPNEKARSLFVAACLEELHSKRVHVNQVLEMSESLKEALTHTHFAIKQQIDVGIFLLGDRSA